MNINQLVWAYSDDPSLENFMMICEAAKFIDVRGAVNKDFYGINSLIHTDIVQLALVYIGKKPLCKLNYFELHEYFHTLQLHICILKPSFYIISKDPLLVDRTNAFVKYLQDCNGCETSPNYHYIVGEHFGYPKEDIDFFLSGGILEYQKRWK